MKVLCFTSFTFSYLNRARVLFHTLRQHHPDWELVALMNDVPPEGFDFDPATENFDRVVNVQDLDLGDTSWKSWLFKHDVIEASTAVKGPFLHQACGSGADVVIYLDPDTALLNPLDPLIEELQNHDIVLTPHLLDPEDTLAGVLDNEVSALRTGIYNLGFVAIRTKGEGARFAKWWNDRLLALCYDDIPQGLFVDQRWCDHVPAFFEKVKILRDPGYNIASWNISRRKVTIGQDGQIRANGSLLRFWHFTKLGPVGDIMTRRYAGTNFEVHEIWNWYKRLIARFTDTRIPERYWAYGVYADGQLIQKAHRELYRARGDLREAFKDPFASGAGSYQAWLIGEGLLAPQEAAAVA
jgi:hypothetical protein